MSEALESSSRCCSTPRAPCSCRRSRGRDLLAARAGARRRALGGAHRRRVPRVFAGAPPNVHPGRRSARGRARARVVARAGARDLPRRRRHGALPRLRGVLRALWSHFARAGAWRLCRAPSGASTRWRRAAAGSAWCRTSTSACAPILRGLGLATASSRSAAGRRGAAKPDARIFDACLERLGLAGRACSTSANARLETWRPPGRRTAPLDVRADLSALPASRPNRGEDPEAHERPNTPAAVLPRALRHGRASLERALGTALDGRVDHADLFFESATQ